MKLSISHVTLMPMDVLSIDASFLLIFVYSDVCIIGVVSNIMQMAATNSILHL